MNDTPVVSERQRLSEYTLAIYAAITLLGVIAAASWKGLFGSEREIAKGQKGKFNADEAYLRESILEPTAKIAAGFEKGEYAMPSFAGVLNGSQIESLILYIESLK